jgi:hypothetical protein
MRIRHSPTDAPDQRQGEKSPATTFSMHAVNWAMPPQTHTPTLHETIRLAHGEECLDSGSPEDAGEGQKGRRAHALGLVDKLNRSTWRNSTKGPKD